MIAVFEQLGHYYTVWNTLQQSGFGLFDATAFAEYVFSRLTVAGLKRRQR